MIIYLLLVAEIFLLKYLMEKEKINKKQFCVIMGCSYILVTGLRSVNVGSDTTVYYFSFMDTKELSLQQLLASDKRDTAFYLFSWLIGKTTGSFVLLTLLTAVAFYYPIMKLLYKYSDDCALSCLMLMAFNFFQFSMTGMRQTIALGFVVLFFLEIHERECKKLKAVLLFVLAILFHRSTLIVLLYFPIKALSKNRKLIFASMFVIPVVFVFRGTIIGSLTGVFEMMGFDAPTSEPAGAGLTTFLVYAVLTVAGILLPEDEKESGFTSNEMILHAVFATALQAFVLVDGVFFRLAWYFALFFVLYLPRFLSKAMFLKSDLKIISLLGYLAILYMYLFITKGSATVLPYEFFWQG